MKKIISLFIITCMMVGMLAVMPISIGAVDTITIASVDDWMEHLSGKEVSDVDVNVTATELDFTGKEVQPCKKFNGTFNGNGVVIKNVTMTGKEDMALFCTSSGNYNDIVITQSSFTVEDQWVGSLLCCTNNTTNVSRVYVSGSVTVTAKAVDSSNSNAGGIIGFMGATDYKLTVTDCVFAGTVVAAEEYSGGIIGKASKENANFVVEIKNSMVLGMVDGKSPSNGFLGYSKYSTVTLENCLYAGGDEGDYFTSYPFTRQTGNLTVTNCYTTHVCSDDTVHCGGGDSSTGIKYTASGSGVTFLNASAERNEDGKFVDASFDPRASLIGLDAVQITGFTRRDGDIMIPTGLVDIAPSILNATYTVTWANDDGTVIATEEYEGGETPVYKGATPTKPSDDTYDYTFGGWTPTISAVLDDTTYTAEYYKTRKAIVIEEEETTDTEAPETTAPETEAPAEEEGGCGSVIGGGTVVIATVLGSAVVFGRKKKEN